MIVHVICIVCLCVFTDKADQQSKASTPTTMAEHPLPTIPTSTPHSSQQAGEGPLPSEPMDTNSSTMAAAGSQGVKVHSGSGPDSSLAKVSTCTKHHHIHVHVHVHLLYVHVRVYMHTAQSCNSCMCSLTHLRMRLQLCVRPSSLLHCVYPCVCGESGCPVACPLS